MIRKGILKGKLDKGYICGQSRGRGGQHGMPRGQALVDVEIKRGYLKPLILAIVY